MTEPRTQDQNEIRDEARVLRHVLQDFAVEKALCDRLVRAGKLKEAEVALERTRRLHAELVETADTKNVTHRRMVRNRRIDLSVLCGQVESCRLKKQAAAVRRKPRRESEVPVEGA
ncbi:MAG: hypothetical protein M0R22_00680 [Dehalococcoidia bacterium]|jgi:hypothetical protein|nr:hypothetical protein [Dehalococcoidia bacterium]